MRYDPGDPPPPAFDLGRCPRCECDQRGGGRKEDVEVLVVRDRSLVVRIA